MHILRKAIYFDGDVIMFKYVKAVQKFENGQIDR